MAFERVLQASQASKYAEDLFGWCFGRPRRAEEMGYDGPQGNAPWFLAGSGKQEPGVFGRAILPVNSERDVVCCISTLVTMLSWCRCSGPRSWRRRRRLSWSHLRRGPKRRGKKTDLFDDTKSGKCVHTHFLSF